MSVWKVVGGVVGGAVVGVAAIAAAPFTGGGSVLGAVTLLASLSGAGTIAAAVGVGAVGAATGGYVMGDDEEIENARNDGYTEGKKDAKAEFLRKLNELDFTNYNAIFAMYAVAVAYASHANPNVKISDKAREEIESFINGLSFPYLPNHVKEKIENIYDKPLNIKEAFYNAKNLNIAEDTINMILELVTDSEQIDHKNKNAFMQAWNQLKAAA